ncbi:MAG: hypothetical protein J5548_09535 [Prevotella sp.]|nr:hypothetical protein [Prevotella sp.]
MTNKRHNLLSHLAMIFMGMAMLFPLGGCSRADFRKIINKWGAKDKEKPPVYHDFEGYSPGAKRAKKQENFNRYHYYISPDKEELLDSDPQVYYYDPIYEADEAETAEAPPLFDEDQYWKDHPLQIENEKTKTNTNNI